MKTKTYYITLCLLFHAVCLLSQSTLNSTGGSTSINGQTFSYSVGEMSLVHTVENSQLIITQGLLQPLYDKTDTEESDILSQHLSVYPNPSTQSIYLAPQMPWGGVLQYRVVDLTGRQVIAQTEISLLRGNEKQSIRVDALPPGMYILEVMFMQAHAKYSSKYKIIKL